MANIQRSMIIRTCMYSVYGTFPHCHIQKFGCVCDFVRRWHYTFFRWQWLQQHQSSSSSVARCIVRPKCRNLHKNYTTSKGGRKSSQEWWHRVLGNFTYPKKLFFCKLCNWAKFILNCRYSHRYTHFVLEQKYNENWL